MTKFIVVMYTAPNTKGEKVYSTKQRKRAVDRMWEELVKLDTKYTRGVVYQEETTWNDEGSYTFNRIDWTPVQHRALWQ